MPLGQPPAVLLALIERERWRRGIGAKTFEVAGEHAFLWRHFTAKPQAVSNLQSTINNHHSLALASRHFPIMMYFSE